MRVLKIGTSFSTKKNTFNVILLLMFFQKKMTVDKNSIKLSGVKKYNIMLADTNLINGLFDV